VETADWQLCGDGADLQKGLLRLSPQFYIVPVRRNYMKPDTDPDPFRQKFVETFRAFANATRHSILEGLKETFDHIEGSFRALEERLGDLEKRLERQERGFE
jgi:hypothetical protein